MRPHLYDEAMPLTDLSLEESRGFCPALPEPDDFETFWTGTLGDHRDRPLNVRLTPFDNRQQVTDCWDLGFDGYLGTPVSGWLQAPVGATGPLPLVVQYKGYSSSRKVPFASPFAAAGYAHIVIDPRGQGWAHPTIVDSAGDDGPWGSGSGAPGFMTPHLDDPADHYFRRLYMDAFRALQVGLSLDLVDPSRVALVGHSQGGAQSAAVAGLAAMSGIQLNLACVDSPFLSCIRRCVDLASSGPYLEVVSWLRSHPYLVARAFATLNYFDLMHFAPRARCRTLFSVAMMDGTCPPSSAWAAYNAWGGRPGSGTAQATKDITVYPFAQHPAGEDVQTWNQLGVLQKVLGSPVADTAGKR